MISIPGITEDEKIDKLCVGVKAMIGFEDLKAVPVNLEQVLRVALKIDTELHVSGTFISIKSPLHNTGPQTMDIENIERNWNCRGKSSRVALASIGMIVRHKPILQRMLVSYAVKKYAGH